MTRPGPRYRGESDSCGSEAALPRRGSPAGSWRYWPVKRRETHKWPGLHRRLPIRCALHPPANAGVHRLLC